MTGREHAESLPPNLSVLDPYTMAFPYTPFYTHTHSCSSENISVHLKDLLNVIMIQNKNAFAALPQLSAANLLPSLPPIMSSHLLMTTSAYAFCTGWNSHVRWYWCNMRFSEWEEHQTERKKYREGQKVEETRVVELRGWCWSLSHECMACKDSTIKTWLWPL